MEQLALKAPNNGNDDEPIAIPPLPPMIYQCTSETINITKVDSKHNFA